jgi:hypothetical protein
MESSTFGVQRSAFNVRRSAVSLAFLAHLFRFGIVLVLDFVPRPRIFLGSISDAGDSALHRLPFTVRRSLAQKFRSGVSKSFGYGFVASLIVGAVWRNRFTT